MTGLTVAQDNALLGALYELRATHRSGNGWKPQAWTEAVAAVNKAQPNDLKTTAQVQARTNYRVVLSKFGSEIGSNLNRTELNTRFRFKVRRSGWRQFPERVRTPNRNDAFGAHSARVFSRFPG
ncbi:hypothetical protein GGX14DRAFT_406355 [Mycena pura]|uniref:Uncharacterized protein n=1 Tax=Mycena pura TaxID=153505 RepID=A0AAD6UTD1_9AGAR|nr:hypothetical protein GGX14DRAFT_406355 [Mycena pura]